MSDDESTPREVLDGEWVTGWEALEIAEHSIRRYAISTPVSPGELIARMAGSGYLPTITNDVAHTVRIEEAKKTGAKPATGAAKPRDEGWRLVPSDLWCAVVGLSVIDGLRIQHAQLDLDSSTITVVFTQGEFPPNPKLHEVLSDPGYYMKMARNILFYRDGLYSVARYAQGRPDDDDLYRYSAIDLSRLKLPSETPRESMERRFPCADEVAIDPAPIPRPKGRPSAEHGEPIATMTIKLMQMAEREFGRSTKASVAAELSQFYAVCGSTRSPDTCEKDAAGLLRAVRAMRGKGGG